MPEVMRIFQCSRLVVASSIWASISRLTGTFSFGSTARLVALDMFPPVCREAAARFPGRPSFSGCPGLGR